MHPIPSEEETAYLCALEECFVAVRGRGVQWAHSDAEVARRWQREGISLGLVLRVVQARVRAWRFRHGDTARLPMSLSWYSPAVLQAARPLGPLSTAPATPLGDAPPPTAQPQAPDAAAPHPPEEALFAELLDPLPDLLRATTHLAIRHGYAKAFDALDQAQRPGKEPDATAEAAGDAEPADPAALIAKVRNQLRKLTVAGLSDAEAAAMEAWLAPQRAQLALRLSRKAAADRLQVLQELWLGEHLGLRVPTAWGWLDPRDAP